MCIFRFCASFLAAQNRSPLRRTRSAAWLTLRNRHTGRTPPRRRRLKFSRGAFTADIIARGAGVFNEALRGNGSRDHLRGRISVVAAVAQKTAAAPHSKSSSAQRSKVDPVVMTSSIRRTAPLTLAPAVRQNPLFAFSRLCWPARECCSIVSSFRIGAG